MTLDKAYIQTLLGTNDKAVGRALLVLLARQTVDEQSAETTKYQNMRGFKSCHARMGTSMAKFFQRNGYLSDKQIAYWRVRDVRGTSRIACYWAQLLEEAEKKRALKEAA